MNKPAVARDREDLAREREREREKEIEAGILWRGGVGEGTSEGYGGCGWKGDEGQEWRWEARGGEGGRKGVKSAREPSVLRGGFYCRFLLAE